MAGLFCLIAVASDDHRRKRQADQTLEFGMLSILQNNTGYSQQKANRTNSRPGILGHHDIWFPLTSHFKQPEHAANQFPRHPNRTLPSLTDALIPNTQLFQKIDRDILFSGSHKHLMAILLQTKDYLFEKVDMCWMYDIKKNPH